MGTPQSSISLDLGEQPTTEQTLSVDDLPTKTSYVKETIFPQEWSLAIQKSVETGLTPDFEKHVCHTYVNTWLFIFVKCGFQLLTYCL